MVVVTVGIIDCVSNHCSENIGTQFGGNSAYLRGNNLAQKFQHLQTSVSAPQTVQRAEDGYRSNAQRFVDFFAWFGQHGHAGYG